MSLLELHRTSGKGEWETIKPAKRNAWQRLAAKTHSVVTPGNFLTITGFALTAWGLISIAQKNYHFGLIIGFIGRMCDIADGMAADRTGTKSPLGESLDAGFDKVAVAIAVPAIIISDACPWWIIAALAVPQLIIVLIGGIRLIGGLHLHPSPAGKISTLLTWFSLAFLVIARAFNQQDFGQPLSLFAQLLAVAAIVMSFKAIVGYLRPRTKL